MPSRYYQEEQNPIGMSPSRQRTNTQNIPRALGTQPAPNQQSPRLTKEQINQRAWDYAVSLRENGGNGGMENPNPNQFRASSRGVTVPDTRQINPIGDIMNDPNGSDIGRMVDSPIPKSRALNQSLGVSATQEPGKSVFSMIDNTLTRRGQEDKETIKNHGLIGIGKAAIKEVGDVGAGAFDSYKEGYAKPIYNAAGKIIGGNDFSPFETNNKQDVIGQNTEQNLGQNLDQNTGDTSTGNAGIPTVNELLALAPGGLTNAPTQNGGMDAYITQNKPEYEPLGGRRERKDVNGVSFSNGNGGHGDISGLTPEQAQRIQGGLAAGRQPSTFNTDNMLVSSRAGQNEKILEAMKNGDITGDKAAALMNRDFRAADKMDRLGGNAESYITPKEVPKDIKGAMQYSLDLNNFTQNGKLTIQQALASRQDFLKAIGGWQGVAGATKGENGKFKTITVKSTDPKTQEVIETPFTFNTQTGEQLQTMGKKVRSDKDFAAILKDPDTQDKTKAEVKKEYETAHGKGSFTKFLAGIGE